jgi:hypothetical protein
VPKISELTAATSVGPTDELAIVQAGATKRARASMVSQVADVRSFGAAIDGTTDDSAALQSAIASGREVYIPEGTMRINSTITLANNTVIRGSGRSKTTIQYNGSAQAFANGTPGTRIYNVLLEGFDVTDIGTGTVGIDLDSVSEGMFANLTVNGFGTGIKVYSPTSGYAVYNRFLHVKAQNATTGFRFHGTSSNANVMIACRGNICADAVLIEDSNDNTMIGCQFESGTDGVVITASTPGISDGNHIVNCRFESNSGDSLNLGSSTRDTVVIGNYFVSTGGTFVDNGTRSIVLGNAGLNLDKRVYATRTAAGSLYVENSAAAASSEPVAVFKDSNSGSGTPSTVEILTERNAGLSLSVKRGGSLYFGVAPDGKVRIANTTANTATPSGATARQWPIYDATGTLLGYVPVYAAAWT